MPRYSVTRVLVSHGLLNRDVNFNQLCRIKEAKFMEKYVIKCQEKVPQVMQAYQEGDKTSKASDFTVSYFMNSFGLSLDSALKASKSVRIETTEIADSVLMFLKNQGFTNTQIARIVSVRPRLVLFNPDEILKSSAGFPPSELRQVLSKNPTILTCSLEKRILPAIGFLKDMLGVKDIISIINRSRWILHSNLNELMRPKISALRDHGVPDYRVSAMIKQCPSSFLVSSDRFSEALMIVKEMGFDPSSSMFYFALGNVVWIEKSKWEEKMELYKSFGWSEDDIVSAFKKQPQIMAISKGKIKRMMDFFVKESGWGLSFVSRYPSLLLLSLEKRIMPRYSVTRALISHGLLNWDVNFNSIFLLNEAKFLEMYVIKYQEKVPQVIQAYQCKMCTAVAHI
ncbi:hypothetical protein QJS10_CPB17g01592 [Acorus calamus]|uniref:Uncharacterized protein n=1 Tax=Acorus calamus TaxID=4465 RepID=A0AAV9CVJ8_ACOCL|nr:hypothetical protein QJS10_CPB17g01592 [Acorus calamus]